MNILLIDDHTLFRESLRRLLEAEPGWKVVGQFGTAEAALVALGDDLQCDLVLLDYELDEATRRNGNGLLLAARLRQVRPNLPILMVTAGMESKDLLEAVTTANVGVFLKNEPAEELFLAMRRTAKGELWVSSAVARSLLTHTPAEAGPAHTTYSTREKTVLLCVLEGLSNKEIAAQLSISESSTKAVLQKLFEKAGVRSRSQLVRFAVEMQSELNAE